ncbi:MAG: hypothetical protein OXK73_17485 [Rhodospirillaceae bacterium]|nr:hypothetical protein [Rhodospirillaceae bacterium]MDE0418951.1 hypothetical protein [bacterium]
MSAQNTDPLRSSDPDTLFGLVEERLEDTVTQVSEQARIAAAPRR